MSLNPETTLAEIVADYAETFGWSAQEAADVLLLAEEARAGFAHVPRAPSPGERGVRVYVMRDARGYVKVGISNAPLARIRELSAGNPEGLELVFQTLEYSRAYALAVEAAVHHDLAAFRKGREWFDCTAGRAMQAIYLMGAEGDIP